MVSREFAGILEEEHFDDEVLFAVLICYPVT